jgi:hypothetical protein
MKNNTKPTDESVPQTVTGFIKLATGQNSIQIGFTDQQVSPHAGLATFAGFLHWHRFGQRLADWLPHQRTSPNALPAADLALGFVLGILAGANKLAQVAYLRRDVLLAPLLAIRRIGSQSSFTRFFQGFTGAGANLRCFGPAWHWCLDRLNSRREGYTLDLDSTQLLHEDSRQEGVRTGYTPGGLKNCLHPLLAFVPRPNWWLVFGCGLAILLVTTTWSPSRWSCSPVSPARCACVWSGPTRAFAMGLGWIYWRARAWPTSWSPGSMGRCSGS